MSETIIHNGWAMVCDGPRQCLRREARSFAPLRGTEVLVKVLACGVCRTDLHVLDGDIPAKYPIIPGHEIVGEILAIGDSVADLSNGMRIGIPWLGRTCGKCEYCAGDQENLCDDPQFTGATRDGGYATHVVADAEFCFPLPDGISAVKAAPLLCAGLIGWRAYRMAGDAQKIGLYGFGAAAHILAQVVLLEGKLVHAFTREGDTASQQFARQLGCQWVGSSDADPGDPLDAAIIFAPVGELVPRALKAVRKGGIVVCAGIHMSEIPSFPYADLWGERTIRSVANLTRSDGDEFLAHHHLEAIETRTTVYSLADAERALEDLRAGHLQGAAVLVA